MQETLKQPLLPRRERDNLSQRAVRTFMWDFADEGLDVVFENLAEHNVDGIHLSLVHQGGRFYCPHNPQHSIVHALDGAMYFPPTHRCYEQLVPYAHPQYGSGALLREIREQTLEEQIRLTASVSLLNNRPLSAMHADCTQTNAMGDQLEGLLCPSNPAVQNYATALLEDLSQQVGVDAIELDHFAFGSLMEYPYATHQGFDISPSLSYLMSLCFCDHCRAQAEEANIDVDELKQLVARMISNGLSGDLSGRRISDEISDPFHPVSHFAQVRSSIVASFMEQLSDTLRVNGADLQLILSEEPNENWRWGLQLDALNRLDLHATIVPGRVPMAHAALIERYAELLDSDWMAVEINMAETRGRSEAEMMQELESSLNAGIENFVFAHYGLVRLDMLDLIGAVSKR